MKAKY